MQTRSGSCFYCCLLSSVVSDMAHVSPIFGFNYKSAILLFCHGGFWKFEGYIFILRVTTKIPLGITNYSILALIIVEDCVLRIFHASSLTNYCSRASLVAQSNVCFDYGQFKFVVFIMISSYLVCQTRLDQFSPFISCLLVVSLVEGYYLFFL